MDSGEDDEIAQLRSTLLHSIRASKTRSSKNRGKHQEQIFDTDIDDLEALRLAALGTVKAGASTSGNGSPSTSQQPSTPLLRPTQNQQFPAAPPQYRPRFPFNNRLKLTAPRSNLIVLTQTAPKKEPYFPNNNQLGLGLPPSHPNGASVNRMLTEPSTKRTDKWSRNRDSSDDDSDDGEDDQNGKEDSGSEDGDCKQASSPASTASDDLQTADDDDTQPALVDGELIDVPETVEDRERDAASTRARAKPSTSNETAAEADTTGITKSRRSTNRLPTMDEDELLLFDDDDDDLLLLGDDDIDEAAMRAAADAEPQTFGDDDDEGPDDEPEVIVSDAPVGEDEPSRGTKQQQRLETSRRRRHSPSPRGRSAGGQRRRSRSRDGGDRRDKRKLETELATVEGRLKQIYTTGSKQSPVPSSSNARHNRGARREGGSSKDHPLRAGGDHHQRRPVEEDRRRRSRSRSSHDRSAAGGGAHSHRETSRNDRGGHHRRQRSPGDGDDRKQQQHRSPPAQRGEGRHGHAVADRAKPSATASSDRRREPPATAVKPKMPSTTKATRTASNGQKARKREEMPTSTIASSVKAVASSIVVSIKGPGKATTVPMQTPSSSASSKPSKMDPTSLIVTVPVSPSTTKQQQTSKSAKVVDLRQKLAVSTGGRKAAGTDELGSGGDALPATGRPSLSIKDRLAPIGQNRSLPAATALNKKREPTASVAVKELATSTPLTLSQLKRRTFSPIRLPLVPNSGGARELIDSTTRPSVAAAGPSSSASVVVPNVAGGSREKLQRTAQTNVLPNQQQRRFIVSDDAPKLDDLLGKQANGTLESSAAKKRRIRLNRPTLQEA